jgi:hypothetical protein
VHRREREAAYDLGGELQTGAVEEDERTKVRSVAAVEVETQDLQERKKLVMRCICGLSSIRRSCPERRSDGSFAVIGAGKRSR